MLTRTLATPILIIVFAGFPGCDKPKESSSAAPRTESGTADPAKSAPNAASDPVVTFKRVIETASVRAKSDTGRLHQLPSTSSALDTTAWLKSKPQIVSTSHDIKKTDSLVSPYMGTVVVKAQDTHTKLYKTKSEAASANDFSPTPSHFFGPQSYRFIYAYQDETWVLKSGVEFNEDSGVSDPIEPGEESGTLLKYFTP